MLYISILSGLLLYPFTFSYPNSIEANNVTWLSQSNGIELSRASIIRSPSPLNNFYRALVSGKGLTVEVWLTTQNYYRRGPAKIVSYSSGPRHPNFTLGQQHRSLVMVLRPSDTYLNGRGRYHVLRIRNVFWSDDPYHIVVTYDFRQQDAYVNGQRRIRKAVPGESFSNWDPSHFLTFGNELTGNSPWKGRLFLVAIYQRALSEEEVLQNYQAGRFFTSPSVGDDKRVRDGLIALYLFTERSGDIVRDHSGSSPALDLLIPEELKITKKLFLSTIFKLQDAILNILAFIPFGFLLHPMMMRQYRSSLKSVTFILITGILFTFTIESLQYFVVTRNSQITDVICNTIGVTLGIMLAKLNHVPILMH